MKDIVDRFGPVMFNDGIPYKSPERIGMYQVILNSVFDSRPKHNPVCLTQSGNNVAQCYLLAGAQILAL